MVEAETKDREKPPKSDKLSDAERAKRIGHKLKEARRLVNQRFDELEAEVERLKTETAG